jgi:two-component system, NarL family, sensor kinase
MPGPMNMHGLQNLKRCRNMKRRRNRRLYECYLHIYLILDLILLTLGEKLVEPMKKPTFHFLRFLDIILIVFPVTALMAQGNFNPDSLNNVIGSDASGEDKERALAELAEGYRHDDPVKALHYCDDLLSQGRLDGKPEILVDAYWLKARIYLAWQIYDTAITYSDSALQIAQKQDDLVKQAGINITRGNAIFNHEGPGAGISAYRESYRLYSLLKDTAGLLKSLNGMGTMYKEMARYDSALAYYIRLITIAEEKGYEMNLGMGYVNMGILYLDIKDTAKGAHYLKMSIPLNKKYQPALEGLAIMNLGLMYLDQKEFDSAQVRLREALDIYISIGDRKGQADALNNLGNVYTQISEFDSAYILYSRARDIYYEMQNWSPYGQILNNLGLLNIFMGNYPSAFMLLDSSLSLARRTENPELESMVYLNLHYGFVKQGNYEEALANYVLYDSVQQRIFNLEKEKLIADLEMKYQNEKKQALILALERDNLKKEKRGNIFLFTSIGIIASISFVFLHFRQRAVKDRIIANQKIRQLEEEKKLLAAKSLVEGQEEERKRIAQELHDGLGVLLSTTRMQFSAIGESCPENKPLIDKASKLLEQAASDVRKISHNMMPGLLTKLGLFEAVNDLFEKLSETESIHVSADIPEDAERLPENKEIMIFRIIQEMGNNTLKHARAKNIEIRMHMMEGMLDIYYADDGVGFNVEEKLESKSMGLTSLQSRVNFLSGRMDVDARPGKGARYSLKIPC